MGRVRFINAFECQSCYQTYLSEKGASSCCGDKVERLKGFECKQCFEIYKTLGEARGCHSELTLDYIPEAGGFDPIDEEDNSDEIMIGNITYNKPLEVIQQ